MLQKPKRFSLKKKKQKNREQDLKKIFLAHLVYVIGAHRDTQRVTKHGSY